jgi:putative exosortase-associated protein (TIGR04073 family)
MRNKYALLAVVLVTGALVAGCAGPEEKFGRGLRNTFEVVRLGDMRRTMEQSSLWEGPDYGSTTGFIKGLNKTLARTGIGVYEMVTFPIPNPGRGYDPVCTDYLTPGPVYPDNFKPGLREDSMYATDTHVGFGGGDVAPGVPGSRFRIFDGN